LQQIPIGEMKTSNFFDPMNNVRNNTEDFIIFFLINKPRRVFFVPGDQPQAVSTRRKDFDRVSRTDSRHDNISALRLRSRNLPL